MHALIPARSGSVRVPNKNILPLAGYPLMAWSIACADMCTELSYAIVTTDSDQYKHIALQFGATVIKRKQVQDDASDLEYLTHFRSKYPHVKLVAILRPTTPLRDPKLIDYLVRCQTPLRTYEWIHDLSQRREDGYLEVTDVQYRVASLSSQDLRCDYYHITPPVGEIDEQYHFDYIEWRIQKYGSPIYDYLESHHKHLKRA